MVNKEYNSPVRQNPVKNYLSSLRVSDFVKNGNKISAALETVYGIIKKIVIKGTDLHRVD